MLLQNEGIEFLTSIGFTETQAKLYLSLLYSGQTDVKTLSKAAGVPRQVAYRTLGELREKGLIERIIALPQEYRALPPHDSLTRIVTEKEKEFANKVEKTKNFLKQIECKQNLSLDEEFNISMIEGRENIISRVKKLTEKSNSSIYITNSLQGWMQITLELVDSIGFVLRKNVKYRILLESATLPSGLPKEFESFIFNPNYEVRITKTHLKMRSAIYDEKEASFFYYLSCPIAETPEIWTNHPSILAAFLDYFDKVWSKSETVDFKNIL